MKEYFYLTDPGKVRDHNEDSVIINENDNGEILMAVADGMGGHRAGEVASSIAISHLGKRFHEMSSVGSYEDATNWVKEAVNEINLLIYRYTQENPEHKGMGTTLVMCILTDKFLLFGNIGDSSGYVIRKEKMYKITNDHTLVNLLITSGELTDVEARKHPRKNILMKALGASESIEMDIFHVENEIDGLFLCSDGLTDMLDDEQINKVLNEEISTEEKVKKLIVKSNNRGGNDNISIAYLIKVGVKK